MWSAAARCRNGRFPPHVSLTLNVFVSVGLGQDAGRRPCRWERECRGAEAAGGGEDAAPRGPAALRPRGPAARPVPAAARQQGTEQLSETALCGALGPGSLWRFCGWTSFFLYRWKQKKRRTSGGLETLTEMIYLPAAAAAGGGEGCCRRSAEGLGSNPEGLPAALPLAGGPAAAPGPDPGSGKSS